MILKPIITIWVISFYIDQSLLHSSEHATAWLFFFCLLLIDFCFFVSSSLSLTIPGVQSQSDWLIEHLLQSLLGQSRTLKIFTILVWENFFGLKGILKIYILHFPWYDLHHCRFSCRFYFQRRALAHFLTHLCSILDTTNIWWLLIPCWGRSRRRTSPLLRRLLGRYLLIRNSKFSGDCRFPVLQYPYNVWFLIPET